ncbi:MAG: YneF family protein [Erysipelotrichaceae bacterium]|nr:YneF family protein [Erysipelotrichaceae bacterium]
MIILAGFDWSSVLYLVIGLVVGGVAGFMIARSLIKKELKKNPPINENMIRAMFMQMGRKPSEAQIRQVMNSMNKNK